MCQVTQQRTETMANTEKVNKKRFSDVLDIDMLGQTRKVAFTSIRSTARGGVSN